ncbi:hypothetical protein [Paenibacillus koleovorans]|nr:hypothetical protein [Paenibacillus koleovorans]
MDTIINMFSGYGLSILLVLLVLFAIRFVYKRKEKFKHNRFE